jgi:uncharacterized membrane protein
MDVRGQRALLVLMVLGCLVLSIPAASIAVTADADSAATQQSLQADESDDTDELADDADDAAFQLDDASEIHIDVTIHENGTATFLVDYRFPFSEDNETADQWAALEDDVESNPAEYIESEAEDWNSVRADGENATEREMALSEFAVQTEESSAPRELGHVKFGFEWSSFAHVELNRIEAGDALSGFTLVDDTTLQIFWPESYSAYDIDPDSDDRGEGSVFWDGDGTEFTDDQPRLVLIENSEGANETEEPEEEPAMPWLAVTGALAVLAAAGLIGWWVRRDGATGSTTAAETDAETNDEPAPPAGPPLELLSNEERVLRLLEERGGRVKQQEVVSTLEWTEAKTSQVVSGLREDNKIEVFRIGRENVLSLPEERERSEE